MEEKNVHEDIFFKFIDELRSGRGILEKFWWVEVDLIGMDLLEVSRNELLEFWLNSSEMKLNTSFKGVWLQNMVSC
jgi:hypothetical protein